MQTQRGLGFEERDLKEMRVLNRILRITSDALLYEANPRHAEILIRSFNLEGAKSVVTPGVKQPVDEEDPDLIDSEGAVTIRQMLSESRGPRNPSKVSFHEHVEYVNVPADSSYCGRHPKTFHFARSGAKVVVNVADDHGIDMVHKLADGAPNARRKILDRDLRDGPAWKESTASLIAKISKAGKRKFAKARLGSKAAKKAERMDTEGNELTGDAATVYRALSARLLYLSMDRPECSFAAKELCRHFANPTKKGVEAFKRAVRFLLGMPRLVWRFPRQKHTNVWDVCIHRLGWLPEDS